MSINEYKRAGAVKDYQNYMKMAAGGFMQGSMSEMAASEMAAAKPKKKKGWRKGRRKKRKCRGGYCS